MSDGVDLNDGDSLFDYPPPEDDCPICFIRYPIETGVFLSCCAKSLCRGCHDVIIKNGRYPQPCPFCREPAPSTHGAIVQRLEKLAEKGNPIAISALGDSFAHGKGVPKDNKKAIELWTKAAELGDVVAGGSLGDAYNPMYDNGMGLEKDWKKSTHYYSIAAKGGHHAARYNLACLEAQVGNTAVANKHIIIAASMGHDVSLKEVKQAYIRGEATKDQFANALRANKDAHDEMKSSHRKEFKNASMKRRS